MGLGSMGNHRDTMTEIKEEKLECSIQIMLFFYGWLRNTDSNVVPTKALLPQAL